MKNSIKQIMKSGAMLLALSLAFTSCGNIATCTVEISNQLAIL